MIDTIDLPPRAFHLGDKKNIGLHGLRLDTGKAWAPTAAVIIYDSAGATTLASTAMTISGTKRLFALYRLTTGAAMTITAAGDYRAYYTVTNGSDVQRWKQVLRIRAVPD